MFARTFVFKVLNQETNEYVDISCEGTQFDTSDLIKNLVEDFGEICGCVPIIANNHYFDYYIEYLSTFLPFIKNSPNTTYEIAGSYAKKLAYLSIANFLADEWVLNIASDIIAKTIEEETMSDLYNIYQEELILLPPELNNMISNKISVRAFEYFFNKIEDRTNNMFAEKCVDWNWGYNGQPINKSLTLEFLEKYIDKPWSYNIISKNNIITSDFVEKYIDKPWNWMHLSSNRSIMPDFIEKYIDKPWSWVNISSNSTITTQFIEKYIDRRWSWINLSANPAITTEFIEKYINKPWSWTNLSRSPIITVEFVAKYIDKPWDFTSTLLSNKYLLKYAMEYTRKNNDWESFSLRVQSKYITEQYIDSPWHWGYSGLSRNMSLTTIFLEKNIDKDW